MEKYLTDLDDHLNEIEEVDEVTSMGFVKIGNLFYEVQVKLASTEIIDNCQLDYLKEQL